MLVITKPIGRKLRGFGGTSRLSCLSVILVARKPDQQCHENHNIT
jgi:hypothetical protein